MKSPLIETGRDGAHWLIASGEATYRVDPNRLSCDCAAGRRGRDCRHLHFVLDQLEAGARPPAR